MDAGRLEPPWWNALLRHHCEAAGLTQEALAEGAELSTEPSRTWNAGTALGENRFVAAWAAGYRPSPRLTKIRYLGRTSYTVESRTRPGHMHHVDTYRLSCTCEAGRYGKRCWALVVALGYEDWRRRQQAQAAASSTPPTGMAALQEAF